MFGQCNGSLLLVSKGLKWINDEVSQQKQFLKKNIIVKLLYCNQYGFVLITNSASSRTPCFIIFLTDFHIADTIFLNPSLYPVTLWFKHGWLYIPTIFNYFWLIVRTLGLTSLNLFKFTFCFPKKLLLMLILLFAFGFSTLWWYRINAGKIH